MLLSKRLLKPIAGLLIPVFVLTSVPSSVSFADCLVQSEHHIEYEENTEKDGRVVVSMGDSYSAGEGISPFYGDRYSDKSIISDWLAHRSKLAWSGMLYLDKDNQNDRLLMHKASNNPDYKENDNTAWYFVASSGAETKHIKDENQEKTFNISSIGFRTHLEPQINVLNQLKSENVVPDYVTLTLGGNDVDFVPVVVKAATSFGFLDPNELETALNTSMRKLTRGADNNKSVRDSLRKAYKDINDAVEIKGEKKPCIIVAGYPRLLTDDIKNVDWGLGHPIDVGEVVVKNMLLFDPVEAKKVNACVDYLDETIKQIVYQSKWRDGLDIEFVDVRDEFSGHEVYSKDPWINGVDLLPHDDDLITLPLTEIDGKIDPHPSGCSIHPNAKGAYYGYRKCVQEVIDKREALKKKATPTPMPAITPSDTLPQGQETNPSSGSEAVTDPVTGYKVIKFGFNNGRDIEWLVLEEDENEMFLLSKEVILSKEFDKKNEEDDKNKDKDKDESKNKDENQEIITWMNCSLRKWLNKEFYQRAFSRKEQSRIMETECLNIPNRVTGLGGSDKTKDNVFLLNVHEAEQYFGQFQDKAERAIAKDSNGVVYSWWLRSPGLFYNQAAFIDTSGYLSDIGDYVDIDTYGVRPAMWISKKAVEEEPTTTTTTEPSETVKPDDRGIAVLDSPNSTVIKVDGEPHDFKIPMIRIPDVPVSLTNKAIEREVNKFNINKSKLYLNSPYDSHYRYYISEKTITIIVEFWRINGGEDERDELIFNIEIKTGELLNGSQVVKLYGMTDKQFFSKVKTCYKNFYTLERNYKGDKPAKKAYDANLKRVSYKYIVPFMDNDGRLFFAGKVNYIAAGGYGYLYFSIDKENINYYWGPSE